MIGEEIGNYRVLSQIGQGGMGVVYLAEHRSIGRKVAVKVIAPELSRNPEVLKRFFNEARATAQLRHPSLVDTFDFGTRADGSAYIIMEYLEGESLASLLRRMVNMPAREAAQLLRQIAEGVGIAHSAKIVHRDLKPDNIFLIAHPVTGATMVKILDFGIAKILDHERSSDNAQTRTGVMVGTPVYMSPEQCRGAGAHLIDHRADIYALGCIGYRMLCGRPPFAYEGFGELIAAHLREMPDPPQSIDPGIPDGLNALVMKALAKRPDDRHQSMAALMLELDTVLGAMSSTPYRMGGSTMVLPTVKDEPAKGPAPHAALEGRTQVLQPEAEQTGKRKTTTFSGSTGALEPTTHVRPRSKTPMLMAAAAVVVLGGTAVGLLSRKSGAPTAARAPIPIEQPAPPPPPVTRTAEPAPAPAPEPVKEPEKAPAPEAAKEPAPAPHHAEAKTTSAPRQHTIKITLTNAPEQLAVLVDGRPARVPVRLPLDSKQHVLRFESARTRPETKTITADKDQTLELVNKPKLLIE
jgi:serine/threonine protein kinase